MKIYLIAILIFFQNVLHAQVPLESTKMNPKITLPPPEAFSFTRYGDIPVGLFTGTMNFSIPLMNVKSGKISFPVSLNYASNGVKVDAISGRTGMDWTLNIGGVITRNIMGKPDDESQLLKPPPDSDSTLFNRYLKVVGSLDANTQPDEYTYNFKGKSGKFYYDYTGVLRELTPSGLQIGKDNEGFKIVDLDGTAYHFSAIESSYNYSIYGDNNAINTSYGGASAWYLTKIKNIFSDSVVFQYNQLGPSAIEYVSGISQTYKTIGINEGSIVQGPFFGGSNCYPFGEMGFAEFGTGDQASVGVNTDIRKSTITAVELTQVNWKEGFVNLHYSPRNDLPGERKLDSITLINRVTNQRVKAFSLDYVYSVSNSYNTPASISGHAIELQQTYPYLKQRLFLDKVTFWDRSKIQSYFYKLEYDDINGLPPRLSFAQDYCGYFNGKNNQHFYISNALWYGQISYSGISTNRDIDTNYSRKGLLNKITYPTGGYTTISYENNEKDSVGLNIIQYDTTLVSINYNGQSFIAYSNPVRKKYMAKFQVSAEWINQPDPGAPQDDPVVLFSIVDSATNNCIYFCNNSNVQPGMPYEVFLDPSMFINNTIKVKLETGNTNIRARAELISYDYVTEFSSISYKLPGMRVKAIKNYSFGNTLANFKRYLYNKPNGKSSARGLIEFWDKRDFTHIERKLKYTSGIAEFAANYVFSSSGFLGAYQNEYGSINYEYVTELYDSIGIAGKTETQFQVAENTLPTTFSCNYPIKVYMHSPLLIMGAAVSNSGYFNGKELNKIIYSRNGATYSKVKEIKNYYSSDNRLFNTDSFLVIRQVYNRDSYSNSWNYFADFDVNKYARISSWIHLDSVHTKNYDQFGNELIDKISYLYGSAAHLQPTAVFTNSSKGFIYKTETKYPHDYIASQPYSDLVNLKHVWSPVIEQKIYKDATLLKSLKTNYNYCNYNIWGVNNANSLIMPQSAEAANYLKNPETYLQIYSYDANGNILSFSKPNDAKTSYIWGYENQYVIAEVINADNTQIAYTSFEENGKGNWQFIGNPIDNPSSLSGQKTYNLNTGSISKGSLNSTSNYIVSYWTQNTSPFSIAGTVAGYPINPQSINGWKYFEHKISGQSLVSISGSGVIDEVRLYPSNAQMKSYTYLPMIGMSSQGDINSVQSKYEYDNFDRLSHVKDQYGNIIKKYCYNYAGQVISCN